MRVGFISDLHVDRNFEQPAEEYLRVLLQVMQEKAVDLLVIGGDISNHYSTTLSFVEELQKRSEIPVYFIPGNHDFWEEKDVTKDTKGIYRLYKNHPQSLVESPLQLNEQYTLVGHPGWYNHAVYDDEQFHPEQIEEGKFRWTYWQDKLRLDWKQTDGEVSKWFSKIIEEDLEKVTTENIILQTHVVTIPEYTMPMPHRIFDFFNAYIATNDLKNIHQKYPITHQFMGHVHFREKIRRENTQFITNSLGYRREWWTKDLYQELQRSLVVLDLENKEK